MKRFVSKDALMISMVQCVCAFMLLRPIVQCTGQREDPPQPVTHIPQVSAQFHYRSSEKKTLLAVDTDSATVKRLNDRDSCLQDIHTAITPDIRACLDSVFFHLDRIPSGEYVREGIIDGTRILIRAGNKTIICDNCLHDFIMDAAGVASAQADKRTISIKETVRLLTEIISAVEYDSVKTYGRARAVTEIEELYREKYNHSIIFARQDSITR